MVPPSVMATAIDRAALFGRRAFVVPEGPGAFDAFLFVRSAGHLPVTTAFADIRDIAPTMLAMRLAHALAENSPKFGNALLGHIAGGEHPFIVDRTGDHAAVLVDRHGIIRPRTGDAEAGGMADRVAADRAGASPFEHRAHLDLGSSRAPVASIIL